MLHLLLLFSLKNRDSLVGIGTGYGLDGKGLIPGWVTFFSLLHSVETRTEAHPASYPMGTRGYSSWGKAAGI
jgi:hypothetical protein